MSGKPTVLIIDDDPVVISLYTALFHDQGFEVDAAADGGEGFERVKRRRPDGVLLDLTMPGLNGLQWMEAIRSDERFAKLPIVILTATKATEQMRAAMQSGAIVLHKSLHDPDSVVRTLAQAVRSL
jgi:two-component system, OmpR family, response regulator RpaA